MGRLREGVGSRGGKMEGQWVRFRGEVDEGETGNTGFISSGGLRKVG